MDPQRLSHYELLERLGAGGMGVVWKARDTKLERFVSVKLLRPEVVSDPDRVQRFLQEAKTTSALNHPNITTIHQLGEFEGQHFITMEFVDGENLRERLRHGPLDLRHLLDLGIQIADGLAAAHAAGVVHRDLKPENVMLRRDGLVKILDFGLAKLLERDDRQRQQMATAIAGDETLVQDARSAGGATSSEPTLPGLVLGTVGYMSPEQVRGEGVDARSDIFALGSVLYEMATGVRPFGTGTPIEVMHAILKEQPRPVHERKPDLPVEMERILRKTLAKDPDERYQTAKDLAIDLRALRREVESGALTATYAPVSGGTPAARPPRRRARLAGLVLALVAVAASLPLWLPRSRSVAPAPMQITRLTASGRAHSPAITPDGKYVAYVQFEAGKNSIWMRQVATGSTAELVPPTEATLENLSTSPDGNWLYYTVWERGTMMRQLYRIATLGGAPKRIYTDVDSPVSFSPDGARLVYARMVPPFEGELCVGDAEGRAPHQVLVPRRPRQLLLWPVWSPDGKSIAVVERTGGNVLRARLATLPASGGTPAPLGRSTWADVLGMEWAGDGSGLFLAAREEAGVGAAQIYFVAAGSGSVRKVTSDLTDYSSVDPTADGRKLVAVGSQGTMHLWRIPVQGTPAENSQRAVQLTSGTAHYSSPSVSPDGTTIACVSDAGGNPDIWLLDARGGSPRQLTSHPQAEAMPRWSPDGSKLAFAVIAGDSAQVWVMEADGDNPLQLTRDGISTGPSWSSDGAWICYTRREGERLAVWRIPAAGGTPTAVTGSGWGFRGTWSPDGRSIAAWWMPPDSLVAPKLRLWTPEGGSGLTLEVPYEFLTTFFAWTPDSQGVVAVTRAGGASNLVLHSLGGGAPRTLTDFPPGFTLSAWDWMPDGASIVCQRGEPNQDIFLLESRR